MARFHNGGNYLAFIYSCILGWKWERAAGFDRDFDILRIKSEISQAVLVYCIHSLPYAEMGIIKSEVRPVILHRSVNLEMHTQCSSWGSLVISKTELDLLTLLPRFPLFEFLTRRF